MRAFVHITPWLLLTFLLGACSSIDTVRRRLNPEPVLPEGLELVLEGATSFGRDALLLAQEEELSDLRRQGATKAGIDDLAFGIERFYRSRGFPDVRVRYSFESRPPDQRLDGVQRHRARISIEEGRRVEVAALRIEGASQLSRSVLRQRYGSEESLSDEGETRYFVPGDVDRWQSSVERLYLDRGFRGVRVETPTVEFEEGGSKVTISLSVQEGELHRITGAVWNRDSSLSGWAETDPDAWLTRSFQDWRKERFGSEAAIDTIREGFSLRAYLIDALAREGHAEAEVDVIRLDPDSPEVEYLVTAAVGPRIEIASIRIEGLGRTKPSVVRARLEFEEGDVYDADAIRSSFRSLYGSGLFESVELQLESGSGRERTLVVRLVERPQREFFVEPGYGSYEGPRVGFGALNRNLFGTGRSLRGEGTLGFKFQRMTLALSDPDFFSNDLIATSSVFALQREEPSFDIREFGVNLGLSREFSKEVQGSLGYQLRFTDVFDIDVTGPTVAGIQNDFDIASVSAAVTWDRRDSPLVPTSGSRHRATLEFADDALGSELDFLRLNLVHGWYRSLGSGRDRVLAAGLRVGAIQGVGGTRSIPLQERFFNGGENTVRSFKEDALGPKDARGEATGGEAYSAFSIELRERLSGNLWGAAFVDAGHLAADAGDFFRFEDLRSGVGLGVRYNLPIGPLRLDLAANPNARSDEDDLVLHIAVGMAF